MMTSVALVCLAMTACFAQSGLNENGEGEHLKLICTPELENLAIRQVSAFQKEHPGIPVHVVAVPDDKVGENLNKRSFALVYQGCRIFEGIKPSCRMVIGRDAVVPFINAQNPHREQILDRGITPQEFRSIFTGGEQITWGSILGTDDPGRVEAFLPANQCGRTYLSEFIGVKPVDLLGTAPEDPEGLLDRVASERDAMGFCSLAALMKRHESGMESGISLVPIDLDGNGQIDHFEDIFRCCSDLSHGIYVGRYPDALYNRIYMVAEQPPATEDGRVFASWMLSGGQENLASLGFLGIEYAERNRGMEQLAAGEEEETARVVPLVAPVTKIILIILLGILLISALAVLISFRGRKRKGGMYESDLSDKPVFAHDRLTHPEGLFYDRSHTWTFMEKDGRVRIGVDDFIQHVTGRLTRVIMKEPGETVRRGESLVKLVQDGKQVEIKSPVSGIVEEYNAVLLKDAGMLNREPYAGGWVYLVQPFNWMEELKYFLLGEKYRNWLKSEISRLRDFLVSCCRDKKDPSVVLQDGGEIKSAALEDFGPVEWEEFQLKFLNRS